MSTTYHDPPVLCACYSYEQMPSAVGARFADVVRILIEELGIDDREFAAAIDISPTHLSQILTGKKKPSLGVMDRISLHCHIDPSVLLCPPDVLRSRLQRRRLLRMTGAVAQDAHNLSSLGGGETHGSEPGTADTLAEVHHHLEAFASLAQEFNGTRRHLERAIIRLEALSETFDEQAARFVGAPDPQQSTVAQVLQPGDPAIRREPDEQAGSKTPRGRS